MNERGESPDKALACTDCRDDFTWSAVEQAFFKEKDFTNEPKRCKDCRDAKKVQRRKGGGRDKR